MKQFIKKLEIAFALLCVGSMLIVVLAVTSYVSGATNSGYPYPYPYPGGDVYLPLIQSNVNNVATATPTSTPTPTPTPTPTATPTATPTVNPYP